jgi:hypothetical protein
MYYRTRTRGTRFVRTAGLTVPVRNPRNMATWHVSPRHINHYLCYYITVAFALATCYYFNSSIVLYLQLAN